RWSRAADRGAGGAGVDWVERLFDTTTEMCDGMSSLAAVEAGVCPLGERDRAGRSPEQLGEELVRLRHVCDLLELEFAAVAAEFDQTDEYDVQGSVSPVSWIRHHCNVSGHTASQAVCVGEQAAELPQGVEAVSDGRI